MSTNYSGAAVLGYRISMAGFVAVREKTCGHTMPEGSSFCPKCGMKQGEEERMVLGAHGDFRDGFEPQAPFVKYYASDHRHPRRVENDLAYVGYGVKCEAYEDRRLDLSFMPPASSLGAAKEAVRNLLSGYERFLELKDEDFGLWVVVDGY